MNYGIIAAGEGSRLVSEGVQWPKPLIPLCGVPMIERLIGIFSACNAESISVIVNEEMQDVRVFLKNLADKLPVPLNITVRSTPSSMHSFYHLLSEFPPRGKFIATTVDTIFHKKDFMEYAKSFENAPETLDGLMPVTDFIDDEKPLYVRTDQDLNITGFLDAPESGVKYISGGIYGLTPKAIPILSECIEKGIHRMRNYQRTLIDSGLKLKAYPFPKIIDVDHAGDIRTAEKFISL